MTCVSGDRARLMSRQSKEHNEPWTNFDKFRGKNKHHTTRYMSLEDQGKVSKNSGQDGSRYMSWWLSRSVVDEA